MSLRQRRLAMTTEQTNMELSEFDTLGPYKAVPSTG